MTRRSSRATASSSGSARPLPDRARLRVHLGTAATDASIGRSGRDALELPDGAPAAIVRLATPLAVAPGDRLVLRGTSGADRIVGALVLDVAPPRGISRRRQTAERVGRLAEAVLAADAAGLRRRSPRPPRCARTHRRGRRPGPDRPRHRRERRRDDPDRRRRCRRRHRAIDRRPGHGRPGASTPGDHRAAAHRRMPPRTSSTGSWPTAA